MDRIPVCAQYETDEGRTDEFPFPAALPAARPVIGYMDGWGRDISGIRRWDDLPAAAKAYVERIEEAVRCPIRYISVGAERDAIILRP